MRTLKLGLAVIAAALGAAGSARAQCDEVGNVQGVTFATGIDGPVRSVVMWDPDGSSGSFPNLMVVAGNFSTAGGVSTQGIVGWNGSSFQNLSGPNGVTNVTKVLTWDRDGTGPLPKELVAIVGAPIDGSSDSYISFRNASGWHDPKTFFGGSISAATTWDPDGAGPLQTNLVIAGDSLQIGSVGPANILRFDGTNWFVVGNVVTSNTIRGETIKSLTTWDPDGAGALNEVLVVGGRFSQLNGSNVNNVAYMTYSGGGYTINSMSGGVNSRVDALFAWDAGASVKRLVIAGNFTTAGGASGAAGLVFWTGGPSYSGFGLTNVPNITQICEWDPDGAGPLARRLVTNGSPGGSQRGVYSFNGSSWAQIGSLLGDSNNLPESVPTLGVWDIVGSGFQPQFLFAGGSFTRLVGYDGSSHSFKGSMSRLARISTGAEWLSSPNVDLNSIGGINAVVPVSNLTSTNPSGTFAGGSFDFAGEEPASNIAVWNGSAWGPVAAGFNGTVNALATYRVGNFNNPTTLYAGGTFTASGGTTMNRIARLSGSAVVGYTWNALGTGLNGAVNAMVQFDLDGSGPQVAGVIVAGGFTTANGATANRIAVYTPSTGAWTTLGTGFNSTVNALALWDPDGTGPLTTRLVAGGDFTTASGISISRLAYWDGVQWQPFEGGGINGSVQSLMVWNDPAAPTQPRLVVGGSFTQAGTTAASNVAVWKTGSGWNTAMGSGVTGSLSQVKAIASIDLDGPDSPTPGTSGGELIIGGRFGANAFSQALGNIARWDVATQRWASMGTLSSITSGSVPVRLIRLFSQPTGDRPGIMFGGDFHRSEGVGQAFRYNRGLVVWKGTDPYIASAPSAQDTICAGESTQLAATVLGNGLVYRWQRNGVNLFDGATGTGSSLSGVLGPTLTISNASVDDTGVYTLNIFSPCGNTSTQPATLNVVVCCGSSDYNCDGDFGTDADIEAFFACLAGVCPAPPCGSGSDFNGDGDFGTDADIEAFFRVLAGGNC